MHVPNFLLSLVFSTLALGNGYKKTCYVDTYDNIPANPLVPAGTSISLYDGLEYKNFVVGPNVVAADLANDLLAGSAGISPFGAVSVGPGVKDFDLQYFFFVCLLSAQNTAVQVAESCTIAVDGYYANGGKVPEATFAFASTQTVNTMELAVLPSFFVGLENVTFGVAGAAVAVSDTVLVIDNLAHCNYS